jgi:hypothetical protein
MSDLRQAASFALTTLQGWSARDHWLWPESALAQAKQNTAEAIPLLEAALAESEPEGPTDEELLQVFDTVCLSEGGTVDEIHLRGLRAVLARWGNR